MFRWIKNYFLDIKHNAAVGGAYWKKQINKTMIILHRAGIKHAVNNAIIPMSERVQQLADQVKNRESEIVSLKQQLNQLSVKYDALREDFSDVESERQSICLMLGHASNSSTPVSVILKKRLEQDADR